MVRCLCIGADQKFLGKYGIRYITSDCPLHNKKNNNETIIRHRRKRHCTN